MHYYVHNAQFLCVYIVFVIAIFLTLATFTNAADTEATASTLQELLDTPPTNHKVKVIVGSMGPKGDTGPTGPDGSDGIGLHLRVFKIGNTYSPGDYVFHSAPNEKHNAMFVAQQNFVAKDVPAKELDHWVELSKGEKGEKGETGATGATGNSSIIEKRMQRNVKPVINETAIEEVIKADYQKKLEAESKKYELKIQEVQTNITNKFENKLEAIEKELEVKNIITW